MHAASCRSIRKLEWAGEAEGRRWRAKCPKSGDRLSDVRPGRGFTAAGFRKSLGVGPRVRDSGSRSLRVTGLCVKITPAVDALGRTYLKPLNSAEPSLCALGSVWGAWLVARDVLRGTQIRKDCSHGLGRIRKARFAVARLVYFTRPRYAFSAEGRPPFHSESAWSSPSVSRLESISIKPPRDRVI